MRTGRLDGHQGVSASISVGRSTKRRSPQSTIPAQAYAFTNEGDFGKKWKELSRDSFRLRRVETYEENGEFRVLGVYRRGTYGHALWTVAGWEAFAAKWKEFSDSGLRLVDITTYLAGDARFYSGVFHAGNDGHALWNITSWEAFTAKSDEFSRGGLRLIDLETHAVGGNQRQYIGVFRQGKDGHALWSITGWEAFTAKWDEFSREGLRMVDVETFRVGDQRQYIGVFREGRDGHAFESVTGDQRFVQSREKWNGAGLRLVDLQVEP